MPDSQPIHNTVVLLKTAATATGEAKFSDADGSMHVSHAKPARANVAVPKAAVTRCERDLPGRDTELCRSDIFGRATQPAVLRKDPTARSTIHDDISCAALGESDKLRPAHEKKQSRRAPCRLAQVLDMLARSAWTRTDSRHNNEKLTQAPLYLDGGHTLRGATIGNLTRLEGRTHTGNARSTSSYDVVHRPPKYDGRISPSTAARSPELHGKRLRLHNRSTPRERSAQAGRVAL